MTSLLNILKSERVDVRLKMLAEDLHRSLEHAEVAKLPLAIHGWTDVDPVRKTWDLRRKIGVKVPVSGLNETLDSLSEIDGSIALVDIEIEGALIIVMLERDLSLRGLLTVSLDGSSSGSD